MFREKRFFFDYSGWKKIYGFKVRKTGIVKKKIKWKKIMIKWKKTQKRKKPRLKLVLGRKNKNSSRREQKKNVFQGVIPWLLFVPHDITI